MVNKLILTVKENDRLNGVRLFLGWLLEQKRVEALLVLLEQGTKAKPTIALVNSAEMLKIANPLAPFMPRNTAQVVSEITRTSPPTKKIGIVLRSCELRALIELIKLKQVNPDNLVLIGVDCAGTCKLADYQKYQQESGNCSYPLRKSCQVCEYPSPVNADITIGFIGLDDANILIEAGSPKGEEILKDSGLFPAVETEISKRQSAISELTSQRVAARDKFFTQLSDEITGMDKLSDTLAACVNCHNCRVMCPICYCRECLFDSPTFDWGADKYTGWAERKGAMRMPADTLLYHLTRLNHMVASCVGCGMCSEACPNDVPVFDIFKSVGYQVQKEFIYVPGRSIEEEPPLSVFKEDELNDVGR
ncbi:MAG: 4Fe-4S dicluster domain-containing protein [Dehalococcoidales bacterium]|nr:4Fe-4S dicluster domain-containing protein [Dehalococcoidales bacterium]